MDGFAPLALLLGGSAVTVGLFACERGRGVGGVASIVMGLFAVYNVAYKHRPEDWGLVGVVAGIVGLFLSLVSYLIPEQVEGVPGADTSGSGG